MELIKRLFGLLRTKSIEGRDLKELEHRAKYYLKNGWRVKEPFHVYGGWTGLGPHRLRVILYKEQEFNWGWWKRYVYRGYKKIGLPDMTVEDPSEHARGDWMVLRTSDNGNIVEQMKIVFLYRNRLVLSSEKQVTKVAHIHLAVSLAVGLLVASLFWWFAFSTWDTAKNYTVLINLILGGWLMLSVAYVVQSRLEV